MSANSNPSLEQRVQALEDRQAIYQLVCGYGCAVDGCNAEAIASYYAEDGVYAVGDVGAFEGRAAVAAITERETHLGLVRGGCGHISTLPYVVLAGDRATATCHTMVVMNGANGFFVGRLSASRLELSRKADGGWQIDHRQNYLLNGDAAGPALLGRLNEGPRR
jgi:uncharacterized protein (TIGR02246 family)